MLIEHLSSDARHSGEKKGKARAEGKGREGERARARFLKLKTRHFYLYEMVDFFFLITVLPAAERHAAEE